MNRLTADEFAQHRACLFRHYIGGVEKSDKPTTSQTLDEKRINVQKQFINSYFNRFIKRGGQTHDHFDLDRMERDEFGIPQDLSKRYFSPIQRTDNAIPSSLGHIRPWLVRHFQYAVQLSLDFFNAQKFNKMCDLRKSQKNLPIYERRKEIVDVLANNQVLIIAGDTGCGKSTQVPQYLLAAGYTGIACTQPRRIACTALARRVAYETLNSYGSEVAYQIRFETTKSKRTKMLFLTEGLLLRQMSNDSLLQNYDVIILDEVHERHLSSDMLIGLLKDLVSKRSDLKLILMSATINLELFSNYFEGAPVIQVPGRLYPIKLLYRPIKQMIAESEKKNYKIDPQPYVRVLEVIDKEVPSTERGDALIFLNGVAEITTVAEALKTYAEMTKAWIILMLHSTLSVDEQDRVFDIAPVGVRKCILSTNIAETSVTIDGIRFVIDSGKVNHIKYDSGTGTQKLTEFFVSKASANQRMGRAGRTGPGTCYRLYSEEQFNKMEDFTPSEIQRVSLQDMVLRMISLNLGLDPKTFPYIEPPSEDALNEAIQNLKFQGIIYQDRENQLTALGHTVAKLPVDVAIGKMLVLGCVVDQLEVLLTVAASLSVQSPFTNRSFRELKVIEERSQLTSQMGDPFTLINVFREWVYQKTFEGRAKRWTVENGIDEHRLYEISKLRSQYRGVLEDAGLIEKLNEEDAQDSRQRRIDQGDKKKLFQMKRQARNADKSRKTLRADKHFDSIMNDKEEEDLESEIDPMKTDVNTVEFLLSHKQRDVENILKTHKLRRKEAQLVRIAIIAGLYPKFALLDPLNKYKHGQELFVHTRMKPFSQIHPNSVMAQYHPEVLEANADSHGYSHLHQVPFYGLLLETTKPYICNVMPMPVMSLPLVAKKVVCSNWNTMEIDGFVEVEFKKQQDCEDVVYFSKEIRREMAKGLSTLLHGDEYEPRSLTKTIDKYFALLEDDGVVVSVKRLVNPPKQLENPGFYDPNGKVEIEEELEQDAMAELEEEAANAMPESWRVREAMAYDPMAPISREKIEEQREEEEAKLKKEVKKESYYEKLLKRQKEREKETEDDPKRVKTEEND